MTEEHPFRALLNIQVLKSIFTCGAGAKADPSRVHTHPADAAYRPPGQNNDSEEPAVALPVSQPAMTDVRPLPYPLIASVDGGPVPTSSHHRAGRHSASTGEVQSASPGVQGVELQASQPAAGMAAADAGHQRVHPQPQQRRGAGGLSAMLARCVVRAADGGNTNCTAALLSCPCAPAVVSLVNRCEVLSQKPSAE